MLASHNSYHLDPEPALLSALRAFLGAEADGDEYTHRPLAEQARRRGAGGRARRVRRRPRRRPPRHAGARPAARLAPPDPAFARPGLKVLHIQEVDQRSTCSLLTHCLDQVRAWSDAHPGHLPITVRIEAKDVGIADPGRGFASPVPWTGAAFTALEGEIRSVFPEGRVLGPADVRVRAPA